MFWCWNHRDVAPMHVSLRCVHSLCPTSLMRTTHRHSQTHRHSGTQTRTHTHTHWHKNEWKTTMYINIHISVPDKTRVHTCPWVCECLWVVRIKLVGHGEWMHRSDTCTGATSLWFQHQKTIFSKNCNANSRAHITIFWINKCFQSYWLSRGKFLRLDVKKNY